MCVVCVCVHVRVCVCVSVRVLCMYVYVEYTITFGFRFYGCYIKLYFTFCVCEIVALQSIKRLTDWLSDVCDWLADWLPDVCDWLADWLPDVCDWLTDWLPDVCDWLADWQPHVCDWLADWPMKRLNERLSTLSADQPGPWPNDSISRPIAHLARMILVFWFINLFIQWQIA